MHLARAFEQTFRIGQIRSSNDAQFYTLLAWNNRADQVRVAWAKTVADNPGGTIERLTCAGHEGTDDLSQSERDIADLGGITIQELENCVCCLFHRWFECVAWEVNFDRPLVGGLRSLSDLFSVRVLGLDSHISRSLIKRVRLQASDIASHRDLR